MWKGKPKIFVTGSTGELGRRVVNDLLRAGFSVRAGVRDLGRAKEVQYTEYEAFAAKKPDKYNFSLVMDVVVNGDRQKQLEEQIGDASVVIDCAGARQGFDILRPGVGMDGLEATQTDRNGTMALIDASVARGVKKFIYISAVLTNARALKEDDNAAFKDWNSYGEVLECKHEAELYLQQKAGSMDWTILRPTPMNNDLSWQVGGLVFSKPDTLLLKQGDIGDKVSRDDVAQACLDAVTNPKASGGVFELVGVPGRKETPRANWWDLEP